MPHITNALASAGCYLPTILVAIADARSVNNPAIRLGHLKDAHRYAEKLFKDIADAIAAETAPIEPAKSGKPRLVAVRDFGRTEIKP